MLLKKETGLREKGHIKMNDTDRSFFLEKMKEMANAVDRKITPGQVDSYFKHLKGYPIDIVCKAMDKALDDRNGDDIYLIRTILTVPEIRQQAEKLAEATREKNKVGCEKCNYTGFILTDRPDAQPIAKRCECLLAVIEAKNK